MLADKAAVAIRKEYKNLVLPEGASFKVTTTNRTAVYVSINGVPSDWVWHVVTHGRHGIPEVEMTPQAVELYAEVERIAQSFRKETYILEDLISYSFSVHVMYDYKINKPVLQAA